MKSTYYRHRTISCSLNVNNLFLNADYNLLLLISKIGIIGGTGLNNPDIFETCEEIQVKTPYGEPSAPLIQGKIKGVDCVLLPRHGRGHTIMPGKINYRANISALKQVGCTHVLVSTASGSLREEIKPGDIVILDNFIDRTQGRAQTLYDGAETSPNGLCHIPMEPAFCPKTRDVLIETAKELNMPFHPTGTCVTIEGPRFSSKAESLMFQQWGGEIVNMTTVPEVVLAKEAGLCYAAVALATDYDCWRSTGEKVSVENVLIMFKKNIQKVCDVIIQSIPKIAELDWTDTIVDLQKTVSLSVMLPH
ncbi:S-methyl-5'-thioadenosine phosphorylase-like isoform X2 [Chrysoperla carnea]|uniref:S-methyl-5'-thioadenosine phosphorylase-like isoform X2 n=1 Tax=Chrysoperla carnea TaxID=189513 RepID=UPI001D0937B7|nr:S-methyl-5'-thioadenosine phosphorylase-like isoform X2 [Chrysoperla carnea]